MGRRTKSVHEIAWSKFNAGKERGLEELRDAENEAMEDALRDKIMDEIQGQYDDKFDEEMATMSAQIKKEVREEVRSEYEDLLERARSANVMAAENGNGNGNEFEVDLQGSMSPLPPATTTTTTQSVTVTNEEVRAQMEAKLESEYDERLESETQRVREHYENAQSGVESELAELRESKERLQRECAAMQSEMALMKEGEKEKDENWECRVDEAMASKFRLIASTSREIDALRRKIRTYTKGQMFK